MYLDEPGMGNTAKSKCFNSCPRGVAKGLFQFSRFTLLGGYSYGSNVNWTRIDEQVVSVSFHSLGPGNQPNVGITSNSRRGAG